MRSCDFRIEHPHLARRMRSRAPRRRATAAGSFSGERRQHDVAVAKQRREGGGRAGVLGAGDRMSRARSAAAPRPGALARRRSRSAWCCRRRSGSPAAAAGRPWRRRARETAPPAWPAARDRRRRARASSRRRSRPRGRRCRARRASVEVGAAAPDADDGVDAPGGLQRQRERAADEADADHDELADAGGACGHGRLGRSAISGQARSRARRGSGGSRRAGRP